jgi:gluconate kinase
VERDQWRRALGRVVVLYVEQEFELISARHTFRD